MEFIFAWYDFWVGWFWNKEKKKLYVFPVPMFGVVFEFAKKNPIPLKPGPLSYICPPGVGCDWCDGGRAIAKQRKEGIPGVSPRQYE